MLSESVISISPAAGEKSYIFDELPVQNFSSRIAGLKTTSGTDFLRVHQTWNPENSIRSGCRIKSGMTISRLFARLSNFNKSLRSLKSDIFSRIPCCNFNQLQHFQGV